MAQPLLAMLLLPEPNWPPAAAWGPNHRDNQVKVSWGGWPKASGPPRFGPNGREMLLTLNVATWGIMCWGAGLRPAVPVLWTYLQTVGINFL